MDTWPDWCSKILKFSKLESATRPCIKKLLATLEKTDGLVYPDGTYLYILACFKIIFSHRTLFCSLLRTAFQAVISQRIGKKCCFCQTI